jgi:hypothetical protein
MGRRSPPTSRPPGADGRGAAPAAGLRSKPKVVGCHQPPAPAAGHEPSPHRLVDQQRRSSRRVAKRARTSTPNRRRAGRSRCTRRTPTTTIRPTATPMTAAVAAQYRPAPGSRPATGSGQANRGSDTWLGSRTAARMASPSPASSRAPPRRAARVAPHQTTAPTTTAAPAKPAATSSNGDQLAPVGARPEDPDDSTPRLSRRRVREHARAPSPTLTNHRRRAATGSPTLPDPVCPSGIPVAREFTNPSGRMVRVSPSAQTATVSLTGGTATSATPTRRASSSSGRTGGLPKRSRMEHTRSRDGALASTPQPTRTEL